MNKYIAGIGLGVIAGILDVIPMVLQHLSWDANISAFSMWVIVGFLISAVDINLNSILKGILISFLVLLPSLILIVWKEPFTLLPISVMTIILGGLLGWSINKVKRKVK